MSRVEGKYGVHILIYLIYNIESNVGDDLMHVIEWVECGWSGDRLCLFHKREGELFNNNNFGIRCLFFRVVGS